MERTKKAGPKPVAAPALNQPIDPNEPRPIQWINLGGLFRRLDGTIVKRKEKFMALPSEIPRSFRNVIKPLEPLPMGTETLPALPGSYTMKEIANGLYNIVDANGKVVNEKPMNEDEAKVVLARLN